MLPSDIVRGWKDEEYRMELNEIEHGQALDNPAGLNILTDEELVGIEGGVSAMTLTTITPIFITLITCDITLCSCAPEYCFRLNDYRL